jgi:hypothetical protein
MQWLSNKTESELARKHFDTAGYFYSVGAVMNGASIIPLVLAPTGGLRGSISEFLLFPLFLYTSIPLWTAFRHCAEAQLHAEQATCQLPSP